MKEKGLDVKKRHALSEDICSGCGFVFLPGDIEICNVAADVGCGVSLKNQIQGLSGTFRHAAKTCDKTMDRGRRHGFFAIRVARHAVIEHNGCLVCGIRVLDI